MAEQKAYSGTIVAVVTIALMVSGLVYRYWPNHERAVLRHVVNLAEALSFDGAESEAASATRFAVLSEYFAEDVRLRFDGRDIVTREELLRSIRAYTPPPGGLLVEFVDIQLALAEDSQSANVDLVAHVSARNVPAQRGRIDRRAVHASMDRRDGDWVVRTAEAGPSLE